MREFSTELKVGAFALLVFSVLAFMTFKVGGLDWAKTRGYTLYIFFNNIAGLDEKTKVKIAGVNAGIVKGIEVYNGKAKVELQIDSHVKIYKNAIASIKSTGLLGDKFLGIDIGSSDLPLLKDGDTINNVTDLVDMDDLAKNIMSLSRDFTELTKSVNDVIGTKEAKNSLSQSILNLRDITDALNKTITANDKKLRMLFDNINDITASISSLIKENREPLTSTIANIKDFSATIKIQGPELVKNLSMATEEIKAIVEENRQGISNTVVSLGNITEKIDRGEGSLGKLVKDDSLYESVSNAAASLNRTLSAVDRFRTFITFQAEYLTKPKDQKGYFYVTLQPRPDKFYILGVITDPVGSVTTTETTTTPPGTVISEEKVENKIEFTAQFARRFGNAVMRIGITENTVGVGGDYFFYNDKGRITTDIWDFGNEEEDSRNPHLKLGIDYFLFRNLFINAGADNILNSKWFGGYLGMGLRFEDEDFKYLFGLFP